MDNLHFLSQTDIKKKEKIIEACKKYYDSLSNAEDKDILKTILDNIQENNWSFLSQQEIDFLKSLPESKWADYLIYRWKFNNYGKMKKISKFPLYLLVEPTSICNLRCTMCFQMDKSFSANKEFIGKMDFGLFKRIIDEAVAEGTKAITLASRGEPTIHPKFGDMLDYCSGKFYEIKMNTNALLLKEELMHKILKSKIGLVVFSADAFDKEGYLRLRQSTKFDLLVDNVKKFHKIREHYPESTVITRVNGVKVEEDFDENKFHSFWGEIADEVTMSKCFSRWDIYSNPKLNKTSHCSVGLDRMYIWFDGICNPCDDDYKSNLAIGNVNDQSIADVWNGEKYKKFREMHFNGKRPELIPCDRCEL